MILYYFSNTNGLSFNEATSKLSEIFFSVLDFIDDDHSAKFPVSQKSIIFSDEFQRFKHRVTSKIFVIRVMEVTNSNILFTSAKNLKLLLERQILLQRNVEIILFEAALFFKVLAFETKLPFIGRIVFHFFECFFNRGYYFFIHVFSFYCVFKFL